MQIIHETLESLEMGSVRAHDNLAVIPLFHGSIDPRPYAMLDEALAARQVEITEVSPGGRVSELRVSNPGERPVLLLDGEQLLGAKQNRVLNLTILVPAATTLVVPVSCVESGRWRWKSESFRGSDQMLYARSRARKAERVSHSLEASGEACSDQGEIWDGISEKFARLKARSPSSAMADAYHARRDQIERFVAGLVLEPHQTGVVFALDGRIRGMELLDHPDALARVFPKLVRSWALDAIESAPGDSPAPTPEAARTFLEQLGESDLQSFPARGAGTDVRFRSAAATGGALVADERVVHLIGFSRGW